LTPICTKSFVRWDFVPDHTGGAYSASPDPIAVFRGPTSKRREGRGKELKGEEGRGEERKGRKEERGRGEGGVRPLP